MSYVVDGQTPVPNDKLVKATRTHATDDLRRQCGGCSRYLEPQERYVILAITLYGEPHTTRLCRYCILKLHRLAETPEV